MGQACFKNSKVQQQKKQSKCTSPNSTSIVIAHPVGYATPFAVATPVTESDMRTIADAKPAMKQPLVKVKQSPVITKDTNYHELKAAARRKGLVFKHTITKADLLDLLGMDSTAAHIALNARKQKEQAKLEKEADARESAERAKQKHKEAMAKWSKEDPIGFQTHIMATVLREEHQKTRNQQAREAEAMRSQMASDARKARERCHRY